jgi:hypothetical protein
VSRSRRILAALRPATVVAAGALAAHQLAYLAGYGGAASHALEHHGHGYLTAVGPVLAVLAALTLLAAVEGGISPSRLAPPRRSPHARALAYAAAILVVVVLQELTEGLLVTGHPGPLAWLASPVAMFAAPFAIVCGALAWLAVRGLEAVEDRIARRFEPAGLRGTRRSSLPPRWPDVILSPTALAGGGAARAPPSI